MTEISLYHLTKTPLEKALPPLLLKVLENGNRAVLLVRNEHKLLELDNLLWTFSTNKLVPHGMKDDGFEDEQPIYLSLSEENPNNANVVVVTDGRKPSHMNKFSRCLDIFDGNNEEELDMARERWKSYKAEGYSLTYWKQNDQGGWEKSN